MDELKQAFSERAGFQPEEPIAQEAAQAAEPVRAAGHAAEGRAQAPAPAWMG